MTTTMTTTTTNRTARKLAELVALLRRAEAAAEDLRDDPGAEADLARMFEAEAGRVRRLAGESHDYDRRHAAADLMEDVNGTLYNLGRARCALESPLPVEAARLAGRLRVEVAEEADTPVTVG